jgi:hypothetical protein
MSSSLIHLVSVPYNHQCEGIPIGIGKFQELEFIQKGARIGHPLGSKSPRDGHIESVVESGRKINSVARCGKFFPSLAGRNCHANGCAKPGTEKSTYAIDLPGAYEVTLSTVRERASRRGDTGADHGTDRRIDPSGASALAHVQLHDLFARYRYRLVATGNVDDHGVFTYLINDTGDFARKDLRRQNSDAHTGVEHFLQLRIFVRG